MAIQSAQQAMLIKTALMGHYNEPQFPRIAGFASAEHLAHTVAYDLAANFDPKLPLIVVDEDGKTREYTVTHIETKNPAILGYILAGKDKTNPRVHVVFRGTADKASMVRDLEYGGAGQQSFFDEKDLILSQIESVVAQRANETDQNIKLTVSGHSLGGGDAQNCFAALMDAMARIHGKQRFSASTFGRVAANIKNAITLQPHGDEIASKHAPLTVVDSITLNHVNSAGVTHSTAKRCNKSAAYLAKKCGVKINVRALRVAGDGIQQSGQTNVLSDIPPNIAKVEVLKVKSNHEGWLSPKSLVAAAGAAYFGSPMVVAGALSSLTAYGTFKAHTKHCFEQTLKHEEDYLHFDNTTPEGAAIVKQKLSDKTFVDNNPISHGLKRMVHATTSLFVRNRKVSPHILTKYEEFQSSLSEHDYEAELDAEEAKNDAELISSVTAHKLKLEIN